MMEIDLVAESADGKALLLGEVKWSKGSRPRAVFERLRRQANNLPAAQGKEVLTRLPRCRQLQQSIRCRAVVLVL